jgi:hypothetical protein
VRKQLPNLEVVRYCTSKEEQNTKDEISCSYNGSMEGSMLFIGAQEAASAFYNSPY